MWEREFNNLEDMAKRDRREVSELDRRLALPVGEGKGKKRGYATRSERFQKARRRRQNLATRLADTEKRVEDGRVSITVGGKGLARKRHNLEDAGLTLEEWRQRWDAKRMFLSADGEAGKAWGNETIRVAPGGGGVCSVTIRLPTPLSHLSNTPGRIPTYQLSNPIGWNHLADEWRAQVSSHQAVGYSVRLDAEQEPLVHHRLLVPAAQGYSVRGGGRGVGQVPGGGCELGAPGRPHPGYARQPYRSGL